MYRLKLALAAAAKLSSSPVSSEIAAYHSFRFHSSLSKVKMLSPMIPQHQPLFPPQYLDSNGYPIAYAHPGPPLASMSLNGLNMKSVRVHR